MKFDFEEIVEAACHGHNDFFREHGAALVADWRDTVKLNSLLSNVVKFGNHEALRVLASHGANLLNLGNNDDSLLHEAVYGGNLVFSGFLKGVTGNLETIEALIELGVDVNARNADDVTPLHMCCESSWLDAVKLLVKKGANLNALDGKSRNVLMLASGNNGGEKSAAVVRYLIEAGAKKDFQQSFYGETAVHEVIKRDNPYALDVMLESGMQLNYGKKKETLLQCATESGASKVIKYLASKGYDMNEVDANGNTAIHRSMDSSLGGLTQNRLTTLIIAGVNPLIKNNDGKTGEDIVYENSSIPGLVEKYESAVRERLALTLSNNFEPEANRSRSIKI